MLLDSGATEAIAIDNKTYGDVICPWMNYEVEDDAYREPHLEPKIEDIDLNDGETLLDSVFASRAWEFYSNSKPTLASLTYFIVPRTQFIVTDPGREQRIVFDCSEASTPIIWTTSLMTLISGIVRSGQQFLFGVKQYYQHAMKPRHTALRLRGGAPPTTMTIFLVGPDYHKPGSACIVLPRHATLKRLVAAVFDIYFGRYFGRGRTYPIELRLMPSNVILAEGFTLLYSSMTGPLGLLHPTTMTMITDLGVVDKAVVQLYLVPQRGTDAPGPSWPLEEVVAVMPHAARPIMMSHLPQPTSQLRRRSRGSRGSGKGKRVEHTTSALSRLDDSDTNGNEDTDEPIMPPFGPIVLPFGPAPLFGSNGTIIPALERWIAGIATPFGVTEEGTEEKPSAI